MKTIAFFNSKDGVGKTSLTCHLAWMYADLGLNVVAADLDPQAHLTGMLLDDRQLNDLWKTDDPNTIYRAFRPLLEETGDVAPPEMQEIDSGFWLIAGDLAMACAEEELSIQWSRCIDGEERAFRVLSGLWRILDMASEQAAADVVLIDVGSNLGALNRAALISAQHVAIPMAPDRYSLQDLRNLGPALHRWREGWSERRARVPDPADAVPLPDGAMQPVGYVVFQHQVRLDRPITHDARWMYSIPQEYGESILRKKISAEDDSECLATIRHCFDLMLMAQEARKPIFMLKPADGAIGGHAAVVQKYHKDFRALARTIAERCGIALP